MKLYKRKVVLLEVFSRCFNQTPSITVPYKYMPQAGFEPGTYDILSTWIWDSALDHSATMAG